MRKYTAQLARVQSDVLCDICGASCILGDGDIAGPEYLEMTASWGWNSPWDTSQWRADVCVECVKKHLLPVVRFQGRPEEGGQHAPF